MDDHLVQQARKQAGWLASSLADALEAALAENERLTAPLGDEGRELIWQLKEMIAAHERLSKGDAKTLWHDCLAYIERQAAELARLTKAVDAVRQEIEACHHPNPNRPGLMYWNDAISSALAILDQHIPAAGETPMGSTPAPPHTLPQPPHA